jgi:hypothetical protein
MFDGRGAGSRPTRRLVTPSAIVPMRPAEKRSREFSAFINTITPVRLSGTSTALAWKLNVSPWWWIAGIPWIGPTNQPMP